MRKSYTFKSDESRLKTLARLRQFGKLNKGKTYSTKGKTWEEIYSPDIVKRKRETIRRLNRGKPMSEERKRNLSISLKKGFKNGRISAWLGHKHSEKTKRKIAATRRRLYGTNASINKQIRFTSKYKEWRTKIFKRDNYTCQRCGANTLKNHKRIYLHAHHQKEFWEIIKGKTFKEAMVSPEVWDIKKVITLCKFCHKKIPVKYFQKLSSGCT